MHKQTLISSFIIFTFCTFLSIPAKAQISEIKRQQNSLRGIRSFYLVVNVEGSKRVTDHKILNVPMLTNSFKDTLEKAGLQVLNNNPKKIRPSGSPYLFVHINTMDAGRGLIPFNVSINFYQPVKLTLNRSMPTLASTWETSAVGIVSVDQLRFIIESASNLVKAFTEDYHKANSQ